MISSYLMGEITKLKYVLSALIAFVLSFCLLPTNAFADELVLDEEMETENKEQLIDYDNLDQEPKDMQDPEFQEMLDELVDGMDKEEYKAEFYNEESRVYTSFLEQSDDSNSLLSVNCEVYGQDQNGNQLKDEVNILAYDGYDLTPLIESDATTFEYVIPIFATQMNNVAQDPRTMAYGGIVCMAVGDNDYMVIIDADGLTAKHNGRLDTLIYTQSDYFKYGFNAAYGSTSPGKNKGVFEIFGISDFNSYMGKVDNIDFDPYGTNKLSYVFYTTQQYYDTSNIKKVIFNPVMQGRGYPEDDQSQWYTSYAVYNQTMDASRLDRPIDNSGEGTIVIPEQVSGSSVDTTPLFQGLTKLTAVENLGCLTNIKSGANAFRGCTALTDTANIDGLSKFCSQLETASHMFYECSSLKNAEIGAMPNCKSFTNMFATLGSSSLENVKVGDASNPATNAWVDGMFFRCDKLQNADIGGIVNRNKSTYDNTFYGCNKLYSVTFNQDFRFKDTDSYNTLPVIRDTEVPGANGYWYDEPNGYHTYKLTPSDMVAHYADGKETAVKTWYSVGIDRETTIKPNLRLSNDDLYLEATFMDITDDPNDPNATVVPIEDENIYRDADFYLINKDTDTSDEATVKQQAKLVFSTGLVYEDDKVKLPFKNIKDKVAEYADPYGDYYIVAIVYDMDMMIGDRVSTIYGNITNVMQFNIDLSFTLTAPTMYNAGKYNEDGTIDINKTPFTVNVKTPYYDEDEDMVSFDYWCQFIPTEVQNKYNGETINLLQMLDNAGAIIYPVKQTFNNQAMQMIRINSISNVLGDALADFWYDEGYLVEEVGNVQYYVDNLEPLKFIEA